MAVSNVLIKYLQLCALIAHATGSTLPGSVSAGANVNGSDLTALQRRAPQPATDAQIQPYEQHGRLVYMAWILADLATVGPMIDAFNKIQDKDYIPSSRHDGDGKDWQLTIDNSRSSMWTTENTTPQLLQDGLLGLEDVMKDMTVGKQDGMEWQQRRTVSSAIYPNGPNVRIALKQDQMYRPWHNKKFTTQVPATGAIFESVYNVVDGVVVIQHALDCREAAKRHGRELTPDQLPWLYSWSDLFMLMWTRLHLHSPSRDSPGGALQDSLGYKRIIDVSTPVIPSKTLNREMQSFLNYIIVANIDEGSDAYSIILRCLQSSGVFNIPSAAEREPYGLGHWCFYALLATAPSKEIAWLLATNKGDNRLGHKIPWQVSIFAAKNSMLPSLRWELATAGSNEFHIAMCFKDAVEAIWVPNSMKEHFRYEAIGLKAQHPGPVAANAGDPMDLDPPESQSSTNWDHYSLDDLIREGEEFGSKQQ